MQTANPAGGTSHRTAKIDSKLRKIGRFGIIRPLNVNCQFCQHSISIIFLLSAYE